MLIFEQTKKYSYRDPAAYIENGTVYLFFTLVENADYRLPVIEKKLVSKLDGTVKYTIPEGTQTDTEFRIRGQGIPQLGTSNKGDLVFRVRVEIPKRLSDKQRELLRQFDEQSSERDYENRKGFFDKLKDLFN